MPVTSWTCTRSSAPSCFRIHARSWFPNAVPITSRNRSSASRVTVRSLSMPPRLVQHLRVDDAARRAGPRRSRTAIAGTPAASPSGDLELGEAALVEQGRALPAREVLGHDRGRPMLARPSPAAAGPRVPGPRSSGTSSPAPSRTSRRTRRRAACSCAYAGGTFRGRPALALLARIVDVVVGRVDLVGAVARVARASGSASPKRRTSIFQTSHSGSPVDDPLREHLADPAGAGDPVGAESCRHEEPARRPTRRG